MVRRKLVLPVLALVFTVGASRCDLSAAGARGQTAAEALRPVPVSTHVDVDRFGIPLQVHREGSGQ